MERRTLNWLIIWLLLLKNWFWIDGEIIAWLFLVDGGIYFPASFYWCREKEGRELQGKMRRIKAWTGTMVLKRLPWRAGFWWPATLPLWPAAITGTCVTTVDVIVCLNKNSLNDENSISSSTCVQFQRVLPTKMQKFMRKKHEVILCHLLQCLVLFLFYFFQNFKH